MELRNTVSVKLITWMFSSLSLPRSRVHINTIKLDECKHYVYEEGKVLRKFLRAPASVCFATSSIRTASPHLMCETVVRAQCHRHSAMPASGYLTLVLRRSVARSDLRWLDARKEAKGKGKKSQKHARARILPFRPSPGHRNYRLKLELDSCS